MSFIILICMYAFIIIFLNVCYAIIINIIMHDGLKTFELWTLQIWFLKKATVAYMKICLWNFFTYKFFLIKVIFLKDSCNHTNSKCMFLHVIVFLALLPVNVYTYWGWSNSPDLFADRFILTRNLLKQLFKSFCGRSPKVSLFK